MNRRELIVGAAAAASVTSLPPVMASVPALAEAIPPMPAWAVGTPGEWNWQAVEAATPHDAILAWVRDQYQIEECKPGCANGAACDCEMADYFSGVDVERKPQWDGKSVTAGGAEWFASGLGAYCDRCSYETSLDECGHIVGSEIVCEECMTIVDWDVIDPEHAAELRAEAEASAASTERRHA